MRKKLIFVNDIPNKFKKHQKYINDMIDEFFVAFDFNCKLKIKFVDNICENVYEYTDCALKNSSIKKHELLISNFVLNSINFDGGSYFCSAICHEFEHIRDYNNMMQTKLFKFNLCLAEQKNFEKTYVSAGFFFWTEIYAYYKTLKFTKRNNLKYEAITFGNLVNNYIKTININKKIYYKKDLSYIEAMKYIDSVNSFIYLCAKFMASAYADHSRIPRAKIDNKKEYKKVYSILCALEPKIKKLFNNMYGAKSYDNLLGLGKYICENIKWKIFKVGLTKKRRRIVTFY